MGDTMGDVHGGGRVSGEGTPHSGEAGLLDPPIQPPDSSSSTVLVVPPSLQFDYHCSKDYLWIATIVAEPPLLEHGHWLEQGNADWKLRAEAMQQL